MSLASSIVGFFGIASSRRFPRHNLTFRAHQFAPEFSRRLSGTSNRRSNGGAQQCLKWPAHQVLAGVSGIATLSSRQRTFATRPTLSPLPQVFLILWFLLCPPTA